VLCGDGGSSRRRRRTSPSLVQPRGR
jgi:hypothetical protein